MTTRYSAFILLAAGLSGFVLISCHSTQTRIYTLSAVEPGSAMGLYAGPAIRIDAVHVPPALDRTEVVSNVASGELKVNDLDHWSAPLAEIAKQALSADMLARLPPGRVIFPHLPKPEGALGVNVDILDFQPRHNGAYLEASWIISATGSEAVARRGTARLTLQEAVAGAAGTAETLSALLGRLADQLVAELMREGGPAPDNQGGSAFDARPK